MIYGVAELLKYPNCILPRKIGEYPHLNRDLSQKDFLLFMTNQSSVFFLYKQPSLYRIFYVLERLIHSLSLAHAADEFRNIHNITIILDVMGTTLNFMANLRTNIYFYEYITSMCPFIDREGSAFVLFEEHDEGVEEGIGEGLQEAAGEDGAG